MNWLGLDIGGANLKAADGSGWARPLPFSMSQCADELSDHLQELLSAAPACDRLAVTMTGELSDCFPTKAEGVRYILAATERAAAGRDVYVYLVDGWFVAVEAAAEFSQLAAASNWHALARYACRYMRGRAGVMIDIGSTTTDIIPILDGTLQNRGTNDTERLLAGELVYTGVIQTPICAVTLALPWRGQSCPVAAEFFATTADAYLLLGEIVEDPGNDWTSDGRPLTHEFSRRRLARMLCADASTFSAEDALAVAVAVRDAQLDRLATAANNVVIQSGISPEIVVLGGIGEFLARRLVADLWPECEIVSLAHELGTLVSACAPAHAVAVLAEEVAAK
jgi:(4-(4-[2-(gamma-L-glutamylamino)ethyl]phenoxymethyl)furan-2-yl)methanamine synthase